MQRVATRSELFLVICGFCICVSAGFGCHDNWAHVNMGLMYCLYTRVISSLGTPNAVLVRAWRTLKRVSVLIMMLSRRVLNDIHLPYVTPSVVVILVLCMGMLLGVLVGCVSFSWD